MKTDLESRISKLENLVLNKNKSANYMLEKRIAKLESIINPIVTKFVYIIHSTMTDDNFYFISDDKLKLKSLINKIKDLFLESAYCEDDDKHDLLFDQLMDLCNTNNIQYADDINESPIVTYAEYLDSIGIDPYEDDYDKSIDLDEEIIIDNNNPYIFEVIGKHRARF
jgi:hypothetical protein